jgi:hypothetical protein
MEICIGGIWVGPILAKAMVVLTKIYIILYIFVSIPCAMEYALVVCLCSYIISKPVLICLHSLFTKQVTNIFRVLKMSSKFLGHDPETAQIYFRAGYARYLTP